MHYDSHVHIFGPPTATRRRRHTPAHDTHKGGEIAAAYRSLPYETLVDDFIAALPSAKLADAIMRDNAVRLYGF